MQLGIFLGRGFGGRFEKLSISSHIRVQITRESVRLIALIGLNMFRTNIIYWKSLEIFSGTRFRLSVLRNWPKMAFFGVFKAFIGNFLYCNLLWRKLKVITRPQYALRFFIWPLDFPLGCSAHQNFSQVSREKSRGHVKKRRAYCGRVITLSFLHKRLQ